MNNEKIGKVHDMRMLFWVQTSVHVCNKWNRTILKWIELIFRAWISPLSHYCRLFCFSFYVSVPIRCHRFIRFFRFALHFSQFLDSNFYQATSKMLLLLLFFNINSMALRVFQELLTKLYPTQQDGSTEIS